MTELRTLYPKEEYRSERGSLIKPQASPTKSDWGDSDSAKILTKESKQSKSDRKEHGVNFESVTSELPMRHLGEQVQHVIGNKGLRQ